MKGALLRFGLVGAVLAALTATVPATNLTDLTVSESNVTQGQQLVRLHSVRAEWFDDFMGDVLEDRYTALEGTDSSTAAQAITAGAQNGVLRVTSGDVSSGAYAANGSAVVLGRHWRADSANDSTVSHRLMIFEARVKLTTDIASASVFVGLTDTVTLEEPASVSGTTVTTNASDAVGFLYDTDATTDRWYAIGVAGDTDSSGVAVTSSEPVADTYQTLRIVIESDGDARLFVDGDEVAYLPDAVTPTVLLTPVLSVNSTNDGLGTGTSQTIDVDYLYVCSDRE